MKTGKVLKLRKTHIAKEWDEGRPDDGGDGYWVELKSGWKAATDPVGCVHAIHEDTRTKAYQEGVMPCDCKDCATAAKSNS